MSTPRRTPGDPPTHRAVKIHGSAAWHEWWRDAARTLRLRPADLVDVALARYARDHGLPDPPPRLERPEPTQGGTE